MPAFVGVKKVGTLRFADQKCSKNVSRNLFGCLCQATTSRLRKKLHVLYCQGAATTQAEKNLSTAHVARHGEVARRDILLWWSAGVDI